MNGRILFTEAGDTTGPVTDAILNYIDNAVASAIHRHENAKHAEIKAGVS